ncbi:MAG TPA: DUF6069 family protein [Jiangellaceae bacterium]
MSAPTQNRRTTKTRSRAVAVLATPLIAAAIWLIAVQLLGIDLVVERWDTSATMTIGLPSVIVTALIAAVAGWATLAILERTTTHARIAWTIAATAVLVLSLGTPVTAATTTSAGVVLIILHLAVGGTLIPTLARSAR